VGAGFERTRRALTVSRVARRSGIVRVLAEIGAAGSRGATREQLELRAWDAALKSVSGSALVAAPAFVIRGTEIWW
jgi:hypothetical protein